MNTKSDEFILSALSGMNNEYKHVLNEKERLLKELLETREMVVAKYSEIRELTEELTKTKAENEKLWSLCRHVYGSDHWIREAMGEKDDDNS